MVFLLTPPALGAGAGTDRPFPVMPMPASVDPRPEAVVLGRGFLPRETGCRDPRVGEAVSRLLLRVSRATGVPLGLDPEGGGPSLEIECLSSGRLTPALYDDESYRLEANGSRVKVVAAQPAGVLRGLATLYQMVRAGPNGFEIAAAAVEDRPRFPWRGLLIDSSRHFLPIEVIKRNLDAMEVVKLNVLHWHLSDDQGFRVESRSFPALHRDGSDGLFYTQDEVREVVEYARRRGIRVVPELDVPGHTSAWFVGCPELAAEPGPYRIERRWGIFDPAVDPSREETYRLLGELFGEMAGLFPDDYFHAGGDEVNGRAWERSAAVQAFRKERGLADSAGLQAYFSRRVAEILKAKGKTMIGWDEVLHADLGADVVVQSYRWHRKLVEAAQRGNRSILSSGYYLDLMFSAAWHYGVDPLGAEAAALSPAQKAMVLGGEACMWGEFVTEENVDTRIWPRAAAIAERLWSKGSVADPDDMYRRLALVSRKLEAAGSTHLSSRGRMVRRLAGTLDGERALSTLADVVEPVKEYARLDARPYTSATALNRLVDIALPESDVAREFGREVERSLGGDGVGQRLLGRLLAWRENDALLRPLLEGSGILEEVRPLSSDLSALAGLALEAIDHLESGCPAPDGWLARSRTVLERAAQPRAEVVLAVVPSVRRLVEAAAAAAPTASGRGSSPVTRRPRPDPRRSGS